MPAKADGALRLDYVSPLPPVRSGISDYSAELLPDLARRPEVAELRVVRLPGQEVAPALEERWAPVGADACGADGRLPLYQMGNNHHHFGVLELALECPGVLTLHDLFLHHLLAERTLAGDSADPYIEALTADHGWVGKAVATPRRWGGHTQGGTFALPAHRDLLLRQRGVLVHSRWAADFLAEELPEIEVRVVTMGIPLPPAVGPPGGEEARRARRRLGLAEDRSLLGSFGFQTPIKRTEAAVRALARPELADVDLLVVGEVSPHVDLETVAREAGVADRVHVTGFVDAATFTRALEACDLCLNLRYPTAGETSAALLRQLAAGRPALVSDYAQFRELPEEAVVRVPLGSEGGTRGGQEDGEVEALATTAAQLLADPSRLRAMGRAARDHIAVHHTPAKAAAGVARACLDLTDVEPVVAAGAMARQPRVAPPTSTAARRLRGGVDVRLAEEEGAASTANWPPGERRRLFVHVWNDGPTRWLAGRRGPGGLVFEVALTRFEERGWRSPDSATAPQIKNLEAHRPWIPLPRDLAAGESLRIPLDLRRPAGPARLTVTALVLEGFGGATARRPGRPWLDAEAGVGDLRWSADFGDGAALPVELVPSEGSAPEPLSSEPPVMPSAQVESAPGAIP